MKCIICMQELDTTAPPATRFRGHPGWGSRFDGVTAGNQPLEIAVCDNCLDDNRELVDLHKSEVRETVVIESWCCHRCGAAKVCGICPHCNRVER